MTTLLLLTLFVLLTACSAYFSCSETAFFSVDPIQLRRIGEDNPAVGEQLRIMLANPTRLLSTILIGNTLVNIALSNVGYTLVHYLVPPALARWDELVAVPAITVLLIFFGEVGPKNIGLLHTAAIIRAASPPLRLLARVLAPLRMLLELVSRRLARHFRPAGKTLSEEEFETVLDISGEEGVINADELAMIKSIVDLEDLSAADVMTPRVDFSGIDLDDPDEDYLAIARRSRKHYLILYRSHLDNIAGFLDVRKYLLDPAHSIPSATIPPVFVPETAQLNRLLSRFQKNRIRVAIVADEYGGAAGILTRGDILEEITGDIYTTLSRPRPVFQPVAPDAWLVDASISLEELNRKLALDLEADTSDRLSGWISERLGKVPESGDTVEAQGVRVRVMQTIKLRVLIAHVQKLPPGGAPPYAPPPPTLEPPSPASAAPAPSAEGGLQW